MKPSLAVAVLAVLALSAQAQDIEARLSRLEARLDSIAGPADSPVLPGFDTVFDTLNLKHGVAGVIGRGLDKGWFFVNYSDDYRIPFWVAYCLDRNDLEAEVERSSFGFKQDNELPKAVRSTDDDYRHSGYSRGHLAPAETFSRSSDAMAATFVFSNVSPQNQSMNGGLWARLENDIRQMVEERGRAWVVTGNAFMSGESLPASPRTWIGEGFTPRVAVPTHLYNAILAQDRNSNYTAYGLLVPNSKPPQGYKVESYLVSIDKLEKVTGCDFFPLLADSLETRLERESHETWPW